MTHKWESILGKFDEFDYNAQGSLLSLFMSALLSFLHRVASPPFPWTVDTEEKKMNIYLNLVERASYIKEPPLPSNSHHQSFSEVMVIVHP